MGISSLIKLYQRKGQSEPKTKTYATDKAVVDFYPSPTIMVSNSFSTLIGVSEDVSDSVREALTYRNESVEGEKIRAFRILRQGKHLDNPKMIGYAKKLLKDLEAKEWVCWFKEGKFPTGHLNIVKDVLAEKGVIPKIEDKRIIPIPYNTFRWENRPPPLRYYQEEMVRIAMDNPRGVFASCVGSGKTRLFSEIIKNLEVNSLIIVPSSALVEQTYRVLSLAFGGRQVDVITSALVKKGKRLKPIRITTIQTLSSLKKQELIDQFLADIDLIVVDENHHFAAKTYTDLLPHLEHVFYRYGFTGTNLRSDGKTLDMWGFLSNELYSYPAHQATRDGFLTPVEFRIHKLNGSPKRDYQKEYKLNYCGNPILLNKISMILSEIPRSEQVLILVDRKDTAGKIIFEYLQEQGESVVYISGDDKKSHIADSIQAFNEKRINILIGSTVIGEGVDVYSTAHLILARGGKSEIAIVQAIGRAVRLAEGKTKAIVHDFYFKDTKYLTKHATERIGIYQNSFGGEVIRLCAI